MTIGDNVFDGCKSPTTIVIPNNVKTIGDIALRLDDSKDISPILSPTWTVNASTVSVQLLTRPRYLYKLVIESIKLSYPLVGSIQV